MRAWPVLLLLPLAGCLDPGSAPLESYDFPLEGHLVAVEGVPHGWLVRVANPTDRAVDYAFVLQGVAQGDIARGRQAPQAWTLDEAAARGPHPEPPRSTLAPGAAEVWLVNVHAYVDAEVGYWVAPIEEGRPVLDDFRARPPQPRPTATEVTPGDHVRTVTVGVWPNGTAFYTNSPGLLEDPALPAGGHIDRQEALEEARPLAVYVFDEDRSEQPAGSRDNCHGTTIAGYNDLLRHQAEGSVGVRYLAPEEAYTRPGAEDHFLYGQDLVFLNVVVAHDGATGPVDGLPDPQGACFDAEDLVPPV